MTEPNPYRFPGVTCAAIGAELMREITYRMNVYPRMIAQLKLSQAEAGHQIALFEALAEDIKRFAQALAPLEAGRPMANPLTIARRHKFTWRDRHTAILRELDYRARLYPQWIAKLKLTQAEADQRTHCLAALLALYEDGLDCPPEDWPQAEAAIAARKTPDTQQEMAL